MSNIFTIGEMKLVSGVGDYSKAEACVMSAAAAIYWIEKGSPLKEATDELECACPVIRVLAMKRNDGPWENDEARTSWGIRLIPRLIGSRNDRDLLRRTYRCADVAVRQIAPIAMDAIGLSDAAHTLRNLSCVCDNFTAREAMNAVHWARESAKSAVAADAAYVAADAAYVAADTADAAYMAADAAYMATKSAADAAYMATKSAVAAEERSAAWKSMAYSAKSMAYSAAYTEKRAAWKPLESLIDELLGIDRKPLTDVEISKYGLEMSV